MDKYDELQRLAGIPNRPTPLTYNLRIAVNGKGPKAYEWTDKPHRLLYDACGAIEAQARRIAELEEQLVREQMERDKWITRAIQYGWHQEGCTLFVDASGCSCGFAPVLNEGLTENKRIKAAALSGREG